MWKVQRGKSIDSADEQLPGVEGGEARGGVRDGESLLMASRLLLWQIKMFCFVFFIFGHPAASSQARELIWAEAATYTIALAIPEPPTYHAGAGNGTCITVLARCHGSCCTMAGTPWMRHFTFFFFLVRLQNPVFIWMRCSLISVFFFFWLFFRAASAAYGSSQAKGQIRVAADSLYHSHSNARSEQRLWLTPQLTATLDP